MRRRVGLGALVMVIGLAAVGWRLTSDEDGDAGAPSPLFGEVEEVTLTDLPDGWARCGGGPSSRPDAKVGWWTQTFGPSTDGECTPLVTVTQVPPGDRIEKPDDVTNGGIGQGDDRSGAQHWMDQARGSRGLDTSGSGGLQRLVVEGCCSPELTEGDFLRTAEAARQATREVQPNRCKQEHSDLAEESFHTNFVARRQRARDAAGCPVRGDIVSWRTEPPTAHCFANVVFLVVGDPIGAVFGAPFDDDVDPTSRLYVRDPRGQLGAGGGDPRFGEPPVESFDADAELPATATDTGFRLGDASLHIDEDDEELVYLVTGDVVEAWPRDRRMHACA